MRQLTAFQEDLLWTIDGLADPSGQQIIDQLERTIMYDDVNHGRLYPNLDDLVEKGYVQKGNKDRRTNYYAITAEGREWLRQRHRWRDKVSGSVLAE